MSFIIGFHQPEEKNIHLPERNDMEKVEHKKSLVRIYFDSRGFSCTYYNDLFDLKIGDIVFVEGENENLRGYVTEVSYSFKIKLSDYKKVIAVADTDIHGKLMMTKNHFISFKRNVMPFDKIITWYMPPLKNDDVVVSSDSHQSFLLDDMKNFKVESLKYNRGIDYFLSNKVRFLELDNEKGKAIVEGERGYTVEFSYKNGEVSNIKCDCFCVDNCKHEVAAMLLLRELLKEIEEKYKDDFSKTAYFSAIYKNTLLSNLVLDKNNGSIIL